MTIHFMKYIKSFLESQGPKKIDFQKLELEDPETHEKFLVYRGKNAEANEYVTFELGQEGDYWFHAADAPGPHILIKIKDVIPSKSLLNLVAQLTAKNSKSKGDSVKIVWAKKQFVFKREGFKLGQVAVDESNTNEIIVHKEE